MLNKPEQKRGGNGIGKVCENFEPAAALLSQRGEVGLEDVPMDKVNVISKIMLFPVPLDNPGISLNADNLFNPCGKGACQGSQPYTYLYNNIVFLHSSQIDYAFGSMAVNQKILTQFFVGCQASVPKDGFCSFVCHEALGSK
jgi:hypothetical protein